MKISKITEDDILEVAELEKSLLLANHGNDNGFLVSAFSEENYRKFASIYEYFYKLTENDKIIGVMMAYHSKNILPEDRNSSLVKYAIKTDFILIKQIFVAPKHFNKGIATKLYKHLFSVTEEKMPIAAVIVMEPFNVSSCEFHKRRGFTEFLNFVSEPDPDGFVRKRSAWIKPTKDSCSYIDFIKIYNVTSNEDKIERSMFYRIKDFISLYRHEDNLNWTKIGMQTTVLFALIAIVAYFFDKSIPKDSIPFIITLGIWGTIVNVLFYFKIKSGISYMNMYKEKIKKFDEIITFYYPKTNLIFCKNDYISRRSVTSRLLYAVSFTSLVLWLVLIVFLIMKALGFLD